MAETGTMGQTLRKLLISVLIVTAAAAGVVYVSRMPARTEEVPPPTVVPVNVEVAVIEAIPQMPDILELPGHLEPNRVVNVPVELAGSIERIHCEEGQRVKVGDVILKLDTALLQVECDRAQAEAKYDRQTLERTQELLQRGVLNRSQLEEAEARVVVSDSALKRAQTNLERATIYSPAAGVLNDLLKEEGEYVSPGDTVAQIVDVDKLKVIVHIPERDIHYVKTGARIEVLVDALNKRSVSGRVTYVDEVADQLTRTTRVEVTVSNSSGRLHSGMIVRARITRRLLQDVVMIPLASVIPLEEGRIVYVLSGDKAERREVTLGMTRGSEVQVTSGLETGDLLIVLGHRQVGPGQIVNRTN